MELSQNGQVLKDIPSSVVSMITTEHYNLQGARAETTSEIIARLSVFAGAISTTLIALAFIAQISHLGPLFFVFSFILFPSLVFFGVANFIGIVRAQDEDILYTLGINRLRHFYLEQAPQLQAYLILPAHDDLTGYWSTRDLPLTWRQFFVTPAGIIAVLTSILLGVLVGLLVNTPLSLSLLLSMSGGGLAFLVSVGLHMRYQWRDFLRFQQRHAVHFPSPAADRS